MEAKQSTLRDFDVLNKLGEGAFGQVFKVKRKVDGKQYALKKVKIGAMKEKEKENALNEIRILASYNEQFIIGYKQAFYDEPTATLCVVMEFASGGDILKMNQTHLKQRTKYKQEEIWKALVHMTKGLRNLHQRKILHRDLKCANIFVTADGLYKLGDLNVSKVLKKDLASTQTGTPYYASPQVWKDKPYGVKSDMWSLGCVLYQMCALRPPFTATDLSGLYKKVIAGVFQRIPMVYSNDLQNVIASLLKVDPSKRPDTDGLLSNPAVHKNYKGLLENKVDEEEECDQLLKTIKYNPKDLKGLKNILPKANYQEERPTQVQSARGQRKGSSSAIEVPPPKKEETKMINLENNQKKLQDYLDKRKQAEEKERQKQLKVMKEQTEEIMKRKERVLSACGIRKSQISESPTPRIAVYKKEDDATGSSNLNSVKPLKKDEIAKLPPRPQGMGMGNPNYKLPPKPVVPSSQNAANRSVQMSNRDPREKSKENLRNAGLNALGDLPSKQAPMTPNPKRDYPRCNSAQKIIYPSWWG